MQKTTLQLRRSSLRFKHFSNKGYALFSCLGREVLIGTLSVATLQNARAEGISIHEEASRDTLARTELKLDEVVVTGSRAPLTQGEAAKIVSVITRDDIARAAAESVNDVLKMATGVDVRQRGGFGVQTDISIQGGTFDQIAILLNGVNISNPQTGHLSADFPVSLDDIVRIEIIEGAASRIYGASAFNGAINIVTRGEDYGQSSIDAEGGSFGSLGVGARYARNTDATGKVAGSVSAGYKQSDGATENSYFRKSQAFHQGTYSTSFSNGLEGSLNWQAGVSTMRYGANTFYSAAYPDQYESNMRLFMTLGGELKGRIHLLPTIYWNRSLDHFQLIHNTPTGENFHRTDVLGGSLNAYTDWQLGRTALGAEVRREVIYSTNLGKPLDAEDFVSVGRHPEVSYTKRERRNDLSFFLEHNILLRSFTASLGVVANHNSGYNNGFRFYPGIDLSYRPSSRWKLTASWNMAFRMPTFTDLFYKSPTQEGNQGLKPEKTQSLRIGAQYHSLVFSLHTSFFYDWGTDMIDWVMYSAGDIYHSANFSLDNRGYEVNVTIRPTPPLTLRLGYAYIDQKRKDDVYIYKSNYAMEYLRHKFVAGIDHPILSHLSASWSFRWQQRMGSYLVYENAKSTGEIKPYAPYGLLDLKILWTQPRYDITLSLNNLTSHRYYDLGNVQQPGFWLMASAKYKF